MYVDYYINCLCFSSRRTSQSSTKSDASSTASGQSGVKQSTIQRLREHIETNKPHPPVSNVVKQGRPPLNQSKSRTEWSKAVEGMNDIDLSQITPTISINTTTSEILSIFTPPPPSPNPPTPLISLSFLKACKLKT